ncbi:unnamed protein product [Meloidogyne enterolobii]|uniref:Uncharacterized protein n=2 Tax=Meloidogyne enterolobii TaxID=390850 RepID=A0ACB0ZHN9_MELEN|nr:unnamed protein product [Meloidogyne enterolobii]
MNLKTFILFLYLIVEEIQGANLPSNVAPIHPTSTNVGEIAPASYENVNGVKYSNIPFYENPKISKKGESSSKKEKNGLGKAGKVDDSNRFSVLRGLTEETQQKMFAKTETKTKFEKKCQENCKEECVQEGKSRACI